MNSLPKVLTNLVRATDFEYNREQGQLLEGHNILNGSYVLNRKFSSTKWTLQDSSSNKPLPLCKAHRPCRQSKLRTPYFFLCGLRNLGKTGVPLQIWPWIRPHLEFRIQNPWPGTRNHNVKYTIQNCLMNILHAAKLRNTIRYSCWPVRLFLLLTRLLALRFYFLNICHSP